MTDLAACIEKLATGDEAERIYAAEDIGYANQAAGATALFARLADEPARAVRQAIFAALLQIEDECVIEGAAGLLDSEDSFLRNEAVELLRARGAKSIPCLKGAFVDGNADRRKFIIDVLSELPDPASGEIYKLALSDSDLNVVITTIETLGQTRQYRFRKHVEEFISPSAHPMLLCVCLEALVQLGDRSSVDQVRARFGPAAQMPGYLLPGYLKLVAAKGGPEDLPEFVAFISRPELEAAVLNGLTSLKHRYKDLELPATLMDGLRKIITENRAPLLCYQALRLMGGLLGSGEDLAFVASCLRHPEKAVRIGAVQALRDCGTPQAREVAQKYLSAETDNEIRQAWGAGAD